MANQSTDIRRNPIELKEGQKVSFEITDGKKGKQAGNIQSAE